MTTAELANPRRGDLVVIAQEHSAHYTKGGARTYTTFEIGVITSVSRDGQIKAFRSAYNLNEPGGGEPIIIARLAGVTSTPYFPASKIDVQSALKTAYEHRWPGGQPCRPFDSLDEVRAALRPLLLATDAGGEGIE